MSQPKPAPLDSPEPTVTTAIAENWRPISGFPDYQVSDLGQVRSLPRICDRGYSSMGSSGPLRVGGRELSGRPARRKDNDWYVVVCLRENKKRCYAYVHRLVLTAFVGPCPEGMEGCHNDGDRTNNKLENLRWDTRGNNIRDAVRHGTWGHPRPIGSAHPRARVTENDVIKIRAIPFRRGVNVSLAREYGVSVDLICGIRTKRFWKHVP